MFYGGRLRDKVVNILCKYFMQIFLSVTKLCVARATHAFESCVGGIGVSCIHGPPDCSVEQARYPVVLLEYCTIFSCKWRTRGLPPRMWLLPTF